MKTIVSGAVLLVLVSAACGGGETDVENASPSASPWRPGDCQEIHRDEAGGLLALCRRPSRRGHGAFVYDDGRTLRRLPIPGPGPTASASDAGRVGHWEWAALSPDRSTLLAQWSAECETPIAFLVPRDGGRPRVVTGEQDWAHSSSSVALGWTTDGRAIVLIPQANPCGTVDRPGLYLFRTNGTGTRLHGLEPAVTKLPRSREPRAVGGLQLG